MDILWLDLETRSRTDIKQGTDRYALDCEIDVFAWAWNDQPVSVLDVVEHGITCPALTSLRVDIEERDCIAIAHNAFFDRTVINRQAPEFAAVMPLEMWRCSMALALSHSLPGKLETLGDVFNMPFDQKKDKRGKALMQLFCKPNKDGVWNDWRSHPKERAEYLEYARQDVVSMRALIKKIPKWNYQI